MSVVITYKITELFGASANPSVINLPVPNAAPGITAPAAASFDTAFPAICFLPIASGGQPPSGKDFNGIFYMLSQYALAMQAGMAVQPYDAATQTAIGGYPKGARLIQAANPTAEWVSNVDNNMSDPDTGGADWISSGTGEAQYETIAGVPGNNNDFVLPGPSDYIIDVNPSSGNVIYTGIVAQRDGQQVTFTNVGASATVTLANQNAGSAAANRIRAIADIALGVQNASITIKYVTALGRWIQA